MPNYVYGAHLLDWVLLALCYIAAVMLFRASGPSKEGR
jgi:hypothetical protein